MKETLTCSSCNKNWNRIPARGRKPVLCPKCSKAAIASKNKKQVSKQVVELKKEEQPLVSSTPEITISQVYKNLYPGDKELIESTKNGSTWHCAKCNQHLSTEVPVAAVPTHHCPPNSSIVRTFERVS